MSKNGSSSKSPATRRAKENNEGEKKFMENWLGSKGKSPLKENTNHLNGSASNEYSNKGETWGFKVPKQENQSGDVSEVTCTFKWATEDCENEFNISGKKHDLLINALKESSYFKEKYDDSKYLLIRVPESNTAISPYVPMGCLQHQKHLILKMIKAPNPPIPKYTWSPDGFLFYVASKGKTKKGAVRTILQNKNYCPGTMNLGVYGCKASTIEKAILEDGRFRLGSDCKFSLERDGKVYEDHLLLSSLEPGAGNYIIILYPSKKSKGKTGAAGELFSHDGEQETNLPSSSASSAPSKMQPRYLPIQSNQRLCKKFNKDFNTFIKTLGKNPWGILKENYFRDIADKNITRATTHRILNQHLDSVGIIYITGDANGTCFLLTSTLAVTCYHVLEPYLPDKCTAQVSPQSKALIAQRLRSLNVEISFNYESEEHSPDFYKVANLAASSKSLDYAILQLEEPNTSASGLLEFLDLPPEDGAVSIIGHPDCQIKQLDLCSVININNRESQIIRHPLYVHVATKYTFEQMRDPTVLTYDTCFYHGLSGSPVFNNKGKLVALHTGGYPVEGIQKKRSVIEYGRSMMGIIIHGAVYIEELRTKLKEMVEQDENLKENICDITRHPLKIQPTLRRLLMLWENEPNPNPPVPPEPSLSEESPMEVDSQPESLME
ncbi:serine protease FAM111A-like [Spea bombifrons]|uniref:serine protease FAM111A-like n=1 Tax=Spea bombifrons TaxID=233779 RepID=UPI00234BB59B|nr:serine protease FAM111A-like [Spea bombifrons]